MYYLYLYENKINGKVYVGQTDNVKARYTAHKNSKNKYGIDGAIKKYKLENFDFCIFEIVDNQEQADMSEIFWIAEMRRFLGKENVYNITEGGQVSGRCGYKHSPETIEKLKKISRERPEEIKQKIKNAALKGKDHPQYGKPISQEIREKISNSLKGDKHPFKNGLPESHRKNISLSKMGNKNPNYGKHPSKETLKKYSERSSGENNPKAKLKTIDVIEIKKMLQDANIPVEYIAEKFKISVCTINDIKAGRTWKNIK